MSDDGLPTEDQLWKVFVYFWIPFGVALLLVDIFAYSGAADFVQHFLWGNR